MVTSSFPYDFNYGVVSRLDDFLFYTNRHLIAIHILMQEGLTVPVIGMMETRDPE